MNNEYLAHYGVKGMKWGVRKAKRTINPKALDKAYKKYAKKADRGSLNTIIGVALEDSGYKKAADKMYKKADYKEKKWKAKSSRAKSLKKAYESYMKDVNKNGNKKGSDYIIKRSRLLDSEIKEIRNRYKKDIEKPSKKETKISAGKAVVESILLGDYGELKYNEEGSKGDTISKAFVKSISNENLDNLISESDYVYKNRRSDKN